MNINKGDYVLATKWNDGDNKDHWCVGFFDGVINKPRKDRYMIKDNNGNQFRANGFRKIKKISSKRGLWLLNHRSEIDNDCKSLWWWVRQSMKKGN